MLAGYQYLVGVFFLFVFPLNVLLRSFAATLTVLYAWKNAGEPQWHLLHAELALSPCAWRTSDGLTHPNTGHILWHRRCLETWMPRTNLRRRKPGCCEVRGFACRGAE